MHDEEWVDIIQHHLQQKLSSGFDAEDRKRIAALKKKTGALHPPNRSKETAPTHQFNAVGFSYTAGERVPAEATASSAPGQSEEARNDQTYEHRKASFFATMRSLLTNSKDLEQALAQFEADSGAMADHASGATDQGDQGSDRHDFLLTGTDWGAVHECRNR